MAQKKKIKKIKLVRTKNSFEFFKHQSMFKEHVKYSFEAICIDFNTTDSRLYNLVN